MLTWSLVSDRGPSGRIYHVAAWDPIHHGIWIHGGFDGLAQRDLWRFNTMSYTWELMADEEPPSRRYNHVAAWDATSRSLWIHDGYSGSNILRDFWRFEDTTITTTPCNCVCATPCVCHCAFPLPGIQCPTTTSTTISISSTHSTITSSSTSSSTITKSSISLTTTTTSSITLTTTTTYSSSTTFSTSTTFSSSTTSTTVTTTSRTSTSSTTSASTTSTLTSTSITATTTSTTRSTTTSSTSTTSSSSTSSRTVTTTSTTGTTSTTSSTTSSISTTSTLSTSSVTQTTSTTTTSSATLTSSTSSSFTTTTSSSTASTVTHSTSTSSSATRTKTSSTSSTQTFTTSTSSTATTTTTTVPEDLTGIFVLAIMLGVATLFLAFSLCVWYLHCRNPAKSIVPWASSMPLPPPSFQEPSAPALPPPLFSDYVNTEPLLPPPNPCARHPPRCHPQLPSLPDLCPPTSGLPFPRLLAMDVRIDVPDELPPFQPVAHRRRTPAPEHLPAYPKVERSRELKMCNAQQPPIQTPHTTFPKDRPQFQRVEPLPDILPQVHIPSGMHVSLAHFRMEVPSLNLDKSVRRRWSKPVSDVDMTPQLERLPELTILRGSAPRIFPAPIQGRTFPEEEQRQSWAVANKPRLMKVTQEAPKLPEPARNHICGIFRDSDLPPRPVARPPAPYIPVESPLYLLSPGSSSSSDPELLRRARDTSDLSGKEITREVRRMSLNLRPSPRALVRGSRSDRRLESARSSHGTAASTAAAPGPGSYSPHDPKAFGQGTKGFVPRFSKGKRH